MTPEVVSVMFFLLFVAAIIVGGLIVTALERIAGELRALRQVRAFDDSDRIQVPRGAGLPGRF